MQAIKVILIVDVTSGGKRLPAGTLLQILRYNESVARCLDANGEAYVINSTDYICVLEYSHSSCAGNL